MKKPLEFSNTTFVTFLALQALDVVTTIMNYGPLSGLLLSKAVSIVLVAAVVGFGRGRLMRILNPWYALVVTWNLVVIFTQAKAG